MEENWPLAILSNLSEGVFALDESGHIVFANTAATTILGVPCDDLLGRPAQQVIGASDPALAGQPASCPLTETMKDGQTRHVTGGVFIAGNGTSVAVDYTASAVRDVKTAANLGYVLSFRDATDRLADSDLRALEALVLDGVSTGRPLADLLTLIAMEVDRQLPKTHTSIQLVRGGQLFNGASPNLPSPLVAALEGAAIGEGAGSWGTAAHRKAQVIVEDVVADPLLSDLAGQGLLQGIAACWSTPVIHADGSVPAILSLHRQVPGATSVRDRTLITRVCNYVRLAIERTQQNEALRASEAHFRSIYDLVPVLIWEEDWRHVRAMLLDLQAQGVTDLNSYVASHPEFVDKAIKSVEVLHVNRSGARIFGAETADELLAAKDQIIDAPESRQLFQRALVAYLAGEREFEAEMLRSDIHGRQINLYVKMLMPAIGSNDTRVVLTEMDVTELRTANDRFQVVVNATSDVVWDFDVGSQKVWCSEGLRTWFGLDPDDFASGRTSWSDHLHPDERDRIVKQQKEILISTATSWKTEYRFLRRDGRYAEVRDRGTILRDRNGIATRMIGSMVDVTEQNLMEEQLRQSQKLEAVGQLTGGIAHDFNNLLTIVIGNAEILEEELNDRPSLQRLARMSLDAADRGAQLTSRLLAFSRKQALQPKVVDVANLLQRMEGLLRRTLPESIAVETLCASGLWKTEVDAAQLETAVLNLVLNARDAMPDGGQLTIVVENTTIHDDSGAGGFDVTPGQYVAIAVTDNGHGMSADVAGRIFEPFFTTKDMGKGSGLGLSMVYGFVKQSGGHIVLRSEPGEGTAFRLYFPRTGAVDEGNQLEPVSEHIPGGWETILVVEDDDLVREHVVALLSGLGYRVFGAPDGAKALELLNKRTDIELLFTDVVMPGGMGGRVLADSAKRIRPDLKVLFTSGYTENQMERHGRPDEGVDLLSKPYRREQLGAKVRRALDAGRAGA